MRIARSFRLAFATAILAPTLSAPTMAEAQSPSRAPRGFEDSWFWGVKGGSTMFTTGPSGNEKVSAPTVGAEWIITRSRAALYLSVEQAFFDRTAGVFDPSSAGSVRPVDISDLRRYGAGIFLYPVRYGSIRPYGGLGLAINVIQNAEPEGTYSSEESQSAVFSAVDEQSSRVSAAFTLGVQAQVQRVSLFAQAVTMPTRSNFLINGSANTFVFEAGVRFNLLGAIERLQ